MTDREKTVVCSFRLPVETWQAVRHRAIDEDRKITHVITDAIEDYCAKSYQERPPKGGGIYKQQKSPYYWMFYNLRGKQFRESTKILITNGAHAEASERLARDVLYKRLQEVRADLRGGNGQ